MIRQFTEKILNGENFCFVKFGDSELLCMDGREGRNGDNHPFSPYLCDALNHSYESLSKRPETYFAEWTGTWAELYPHRNVNFVEYETLLPTVHNPDLLGLFEFYKAIKESQRKKIYVGPKRSRPVIDLLDIDVFIEVPLYNCWEDRERVHKEIAKVYESNCIIMFSCTMLANVLIGQWYHGLETCLDLGSAFDPYCNIQNRERQMTPMEAKRYFTDGNLPNKSTKENTYFVHIRKPYPPYDYYESYNDYFRLVKLAGFKECDIEQVEPYSDNTYIFTLNYWGPRQEPLPDVFFPADRRARYIHHQIERYNIIDERFDEIWLSDQSMPELRHPKARLVVLGGHPDFMEPLNVGKLYDFYHLCYTHGRREGMIAALAEKHYRISPAPSNRVGKNMAMQQSRVGLAIHQHEDSLDMIEPLRYTVFSCMKLPILAEKSLDVHPYKVYSYEDFMEGKLTLEEITDWETNWVQMTQEYTFEKCVMKQINR